MKTKEELNALKKEVEALNKKLAELTEEEIMQVSGGGDETMTLMVCRAFDCNYKKIWKGNYYGKIVQCPGCGKMTLEGYDIL